MSPGAVDGWIGAISDGAFADTGAPVSPAPAALDGVDLPLVGSVVVAGRAHATVSNLRATPVPFTRSDVAVGTMKGVAAADYIASLPGQLFADLRLSATADLGVPSQTVAPPPDLSAGIGALLKADLAPVDAALAGALNALGITVGEADTWVRGDPCGQGALEN